MEIHIVHIKEKFQNLAEASAGDDREGIAVLGFLVKNGSENPAFRNVINLLTKIQEKDESSTLPKARLSDLLPSTDKLKRYFRYLGSLTTPDCQEKVIWTLFKEPIQLDENQITTFSKTLFYDNKKTTSMKDNFRPVQIRGQRKVQDSGAGSLLPSARAVTLAPALAGLLVSLLL
ncbi:carbonic anhydrase 4 [Tachyglossus aculeatus]|uniref:carbonic anhydrase 4 n=1 Tax=Tachyglossus aculeatus TaxID=9261 RepID=UPI0018F45D81|nr:carbonic anhydrase 4 [Tachyglossus aculeatus]